MILIHLLLIFKKYNIPLDKDFCGVHAIINSIRNESITSNKWPGIFMCKLSELHICNKERKSVSSIIQIKVKLLTGSLRKKWLAL